MEAVANRETQIDQLSPPPNSEERSFPFFPRLDYPPAKDSVSIRHPGYDDKDNNLLIKFTAVDYHQCGLHFGTAHTACGIIAGNRWDGYFTQTKDGPRLDFEIDNGLPVGDYYYHLPPPSPSDGDNGMSFSLVAASVFSPNSRLEVDQEFSNTRSFPALPTGYSRTGTFRAPGSNSPNLRMASRFRPLLVGSRNMLRPSRWHIFVPRKSSNGLWKM